MQKFIIVPKKDALPIISAKDAEEAYAKWESICYGRIKEKFELVPMPENGITNEVVFQLDQTGGEIAIDTPAGKLCCSAIRSNPEENTHAELWLYIVPKNTDDVIEVASLSDCRDKSQPENIRLLVHKDAFSEMPTDIFNYPRKDICEALGVEID